MSSYVFHDDVSAGIVAQGESVEYKIDWYSSNKTPPDNGDHTYWLQMCTINGANNEPLPNGLEASFEPEWISSEFDNSWDSGSQYYPGVSLIITASADAELQENLSFQAWLSWYNSDYSEIHQHEVSGTLTVVQAQDFTEYFTTLTLGSDTGDGAFEDRALTFEPTAFDSSTLSVLMSHPYGDEASWLVELDNASDLPEGLIITYNQELLDNQMNIYITPDDNQVGSCKIFIAPELDCPIGTHTLTFKLTQGPHPATTAGEVLTISGDVLVLDIMSLYTSRIYIDPGTSIVTISDHTNYNTLEDVTLYAEFQFDGTPNDGLAIDLVPSFYQLPNDYSNGGGSQVEWDITPTFYRGGITSTDWWLADTGHGAITSIDSENDLDPDTPEDRVFFMKFVVPEEYAVDDTVYSNLVVRLTHPSEDYVIQSNPFTITLTHTMRAEIVEGSISVPEQIVMGDYADVTFTVRRVLGTTGTVYAGFKSYDENRLGRDSTITSLGSMPIEYASNTDDDVTVTYTLSGLSASSSIDDIKLLATISDDQDKLIYDGDNPVSEHHQQAWDHFYRYINYVGFSATINIEVRRMKVIEFANYAIVGTVYREDNECPDQTMDLWNTTWSEGSFSAEPVVPSVAGTPFEIFLNVNDAVPVGSFTDATLGFTTVGNDHGEVSCFDKVHFSVMPAFFCLPERTPVIEHNGTLRVLPGNTGTIKGHPAKGVWFGWIDREYFKGAHKPEAKWYHYDPTIEPFGRQEKDPNLPWSFSANGTNVSGSNGFQDGPQYYRLAQIYDGNQRSLLSPPIEVEYNAGEDSGDPPVPDYVTQKFTIQIPKDAFINRVTEMEVYRSDKIDGSYDRVLNIPLSDDNVLDTSQSVYKLESDDFTGAVSGMPYWTGEDTEDLPKETEDPNNPGGNTGGESLIKSSHWVGYNEDGGKVLTFRHSDDHDYYQRLYIGDSGKLRCTMLSTDGSSTNGEEAPMWKTGELYWDHKFQFKNYQWRLGTFLILPTGWEMEPIHSGYRAELRCHMGMDIVRTTDATIIAYAEGRLVGKFLKHGSEMREIIQNKGNFIRVKEPYDEVIESEANNFTLLETDVNLTYGDGTITVDDNSVPVFNITFSDPILPPLGTTGIEGEISIHVNGKYAIMLNGRLFQSDIVLDPYKKNEVQPYWVSYSELDQPDVNPVSNVMQFLDKERGAHTGLVDLFGKLAVLQENGMFLVNCPPNVSPANWSITEAMHNIGNISPYGGISQGDRLYIIYHDGIYRLTANNLASSDQTPTEKLKITNPIQDIFDGIHDKTDVISTYDQLHDEIMFRWHRNPTNLVRNSTFTSGANHWEVHDFNTIFRYEDLAYPEAGYKVNINADGTSEYYGTSITGEFIEIDPSKVYTFSCLARVELYTSGNFYFNFLWYDKNKKLIAGVYPTVMYRNGADATWTRSSKTYGPETGSVTYNGVDGTVHALNNPTAKYVRVRAYWWHPDQSTGYWSNGNAWIDEIAVTEGFGSTWTAYEDSQEIYAFNVVTQTWREIGLNGSVGSFTTDENGRPLFWDDMDYDIKSFAIPDPAGVEAKLVTHPMMLTGDRSEMVRQVITKTKNNGDITVNVIGNGDTGSKTTITAPAQTRPTLSKKRLKKRCKDVQFEVIAPAGVTDAEIHNMEIEYS